MYFNDAYVFSIIQLSTTLIVTQLSLLLVMEGHFQ